MRTFFSIAPEPDSCLAIHRWAELNWPHIGRLVPAQNYHLTLAFLDQTTRTQRDSIERQLHDVEPPIFDLQLDQIGYWPDSQVLWLAPGRPPEALMKLAQRCARVANNAGIKVGKRRFKPHLTLARRVLQPPPAAMLEGEFSTRIDGFALCESIRASSGVRYRDVAGWYARE